MHVDCPYCDTPLDVESRTGRVKCGECLKEFRVTETKVVTCPNCDSVLEAPEGARAVLCGQCRQRIDLAPPPVLDEQPPSTPSVSFPPESAAEKAEAHEETSVIDSPSGYDEDRVQAMRAEFGARYEVLESLGHGGMGAIYKARQKQPSRLVVLKVMLNGRFASRRYRLRFEREAQAVARLKHPGIVSVYEYGEVNGQPYFTMEYVEGCNVKEYVLRHSLDKRQICELLTKTCKSVAYAHQRGVIHRDIKPTNILVDGEGNPRLLDFGLARLAGDLGEEHGQMTEAGEVMGTPSYMSPEQTLGRAEELDIRTDVYSLGVLFYELLTDTLPYRTDRTRPLESLRTIREFVPKVPSVINPRIDGDLDSIVMKCIEKERDLRYQSAVELSEDIGRYLRGQPVEARPSTTFYHLRKLLWRHKSVVLPMFALVLVIMALTAVFVSRVSRAQKEAQRAALDADAATVRSRDKQQKLVHFIMDLQSVRRRAETLLAEGRWEDAYRMALVAEEELPPEAGLAGFGAEVRTTIASSTAEEAKKVSGLIESLAFQDARERIQRLRDLAGRLDLPALGDQMDEAAKGFDEASWQSLFRYIQQSKRSARALQKFLVECPGNSHAGEARQLLGKLIGETRFSVWPFDADEAVRRQKLTAKVLEIPVDFSLTLPGGGQANFTLVPAGEFIMGCSREGSGFNADQEPEHPVRLTDPVYMSVTEVTCEQFEAATGRALALSRRPAGAVNAPAAVSWEDAQLFCTKLSARNKDRLAIRLPTEAEWEYACRAGSEGLYGFGDDPGLLQLPDAAWYAADSQGQAHPVGLKKANAWGLRDMHGNMLEWCADWYDARYYLSSPLQNPDGSPAGAYKTLRGGSWSDAPEELRSAYRKAAPPDSVRPTYGFRICFNVFAGQQDKPVPDSPVMLLRP
jgi:formylglycine-generating enzyme required for sulfatase activity/tRNA A-37 threonylcarbamoyl transferase component Bud32/ribosomal protein S27E